MHGILHIPVRTKFAFDVFVTQDARLDIEMLAVGTEEAAVKRDRRKEG